MAQSQTEDHSVAWRSVRRRHSTDETLSGRVEHFHPYHRQFSDGTTAAACVQPHSPSFSCLPEVCTPQSRSWVQRNNSIQAFYPEAPATTTESFCYSPDGPSFTSPNNLSQVPSKPYAAANQCNSSKYALQSLSSAASQETSSQSLFPKPIYSYSILIFMALKNSKTGSLPVSEIYSFMTEHFPYFKTAPDGWKNSVRHNLSLNKCFEKVENKNGNSSRKGCLWALNPAKVDKMQEELHKWRRKDPVTVRRSMAKPEDLDHLLGKKPDKFRSLAPYHTMSTRLHTYGSSPCYASEQRSPPCPNSQRSQYQLTPPVSQQPLYFPLTAPCPNHSFTLYSPCGQQPVASIPSATRSLNSPVAGKMPPAYGVALQDGHIASHRSMQELLLDGDNICDIDTLNPSLTDLQLQGNLWEELKEESAESDPRVVTSLSPCTTSAAQSPDDRSSCLQAPVAVTLTSEWNHDKFEDKNTGRVWGAEQYNYSNGCNPGVYSGVESLAGCLTSCTTSVSLM